MQCQHLLKIDTFLQKLFASTDIQNYQTSHWQIWWIAANSHLFLSSDGRHHFQKETDHDCGLKSARGRHEMTSPAATIDPKDGRDLNSSKDPWKTLLRLKPCSDKPMKFELVIKDEIYHATITLLLLINEGIHLLYTLLKLLQWPFSLLPDYYWWYICTFIFFL